MPAPWLWFDCNRTIVFFCATFAVGLASFVLWELFGSAHPIVDLRVFRYRNVRFGAATALLLGMVVFGPTVILPQYVQGVLGFTATLSGLLLLMRALPVIVLTPLVARLTSRIDVRVLLVLGFAISSTSFALTGLRMTPVSDFDTFVGVLVLSGIGQAMLLVGVLGSVPAPDAPKASSFISLSVQLGGSIASTMLVTILDRRTSFHSDMYRHAANLANPLLRNDPHAPAALATIARMLQRQATNAGFADAILTLAPLAAAAVGLALLLQRPPERQAVPIVAAE